ncbi:MAG: hypothetical protein ACRED4_06865 [Brevundimonas sp.]
MRHLSPKELSARNKRSYAIAGALIVFIVLVFSVTVLNLKRNVEARVAAVEAGQPVGYAE